MPTLDDVYHKFGEAAEAAQLIETELRTLLLIIDGMIEGGLLEMPDRDFASKISNELDQQTLGELINNVRDKTPALDHLWQALNDARKNRDRLFLAFYPQHNMRKFSDEGREKMMRDLGKIHAVLLDAYTAVLDFTNSLDTRHLDTRK